MTLTVRSTRRPTHHFGVGYARENEEANLLTFRFADAAPMRRVAGFGKLCGSMSGLSSARA